MPKGRHFDFDVIVIGGGHAGTEAAWAAANCGGHVALVTMDPARIGTMSCNPAIGGLAKGQMVREIDALGGLMGLAADRTGIQFRILNASKGPAVQGPRCQSDKYRYAQEVRRLIATRPNIQVMAATVEDFIVENGRCTGVIVKPSSKSKPWRHNSEKISDGTQCDPSSLGPSGAPSFFAPSTVLTTGTFMRGLLHTGERKTQGGRIGESAAVCISQSLQKMGFELDRLKTGTPPRLAAESIDFNSLQLQPGDPCPQPFSDLTDPDRFPLLEQRPCHLTHTNPTIHDTIRANLHRAPIYNGQIGSSTGPRYCPSIEDKVVRFADRDSHHVYLEPESLDTNEIYCNGISTSLPADVQEMVVRQMRGCQNARILHHGYAVEYDMVPSHQIDATCMSKHMSGLFLAGQINGTSGYEEAAGQGLMAGLNAVRFAHGHPLVRLRRDQAYIGVMLDDLVTKTPREPYRMFTSRAEFRLLLRSDNADERLTPLGRAWGLVNNERWQRYCQRRTALEALKEHIDADCDDGSYRWLRSPQVTIEQISAVLEGASLPPAARNRRVIARFLADLKYAGYIERQQRDVARLAAQEQATIPENFDFNHIKGLRHEAQAILGRFRPRTIGQAGRLSGVNPADLMLVSVAMKRKD